jgi:hypothetical protein
MENNHPKKRFVIVEHECLGGHSHQILIERGNAKRLASYNPGMLRVAVVTTIMECATELMVVEMTELPMRLSKSATKFMSRSDENDAPVTLQNKAASAEMMVVESKALVASFHTFRLTLPLPPQPNSL